MAKISTKNYRIKLRVLITMMTNDNEKKKTGKNFPNDRPEQQQKISIF